MSWRLSYQTVFQSIFYAIAHKKAIQSVSLGICSTFTPQFVVCVYVAVCSVCVRDEGKKYTSHFLDSKNRFSAPASNGIFLHSLFLDIMFWSCHTDMYGKITGIALVFLFFSHHLHPPHVGRLVIARKFDGWKSCTIDIQLSYHIPLSLLP